MTVRMHATLVDVRRYCREPLMSPFPNAPTVSPDGRWVSQEHHRREGEDEYLCDDHPFLGWIPGYDLWFHAASRSHKAQGGMGSRWRPMVMQP